MPLVGYLYALIGLGSLVPLGMLVLYGPPLDVMGLQLFIWYVFPLLNTTACFVIAYGLVTLRRWGRSITIVYNGFWLVAIALGIGYSRFVERPAASWTIGATVFVTVVGAFLIGVILLCSTERLKALMRG